HESNHILGLPAKQLQASRSRSFGRDLILRADARQSTNSTLTFVSRRRSCSPGRMLRQGMVSSSRRNITCGSRRGGKERKSGSTGKSNFSVAIVSFSSRLFLDCEAGYFFIYFQRTIFQKKLLPFFRPEVQSMDSD